jgi:hypothetical protein
MHFSTHDELERSVDVKQAEIWKRRCGMLYVLLLLFSIPLLSSPLPSLPSLCGARTISSFVVPNSTLCALYPSPHLSVTAACAFLAHLRISISTHVLHLSFLDTTTNRPP